MSLLSKILKLQLLLLLVIAILNPTFGNEPDSLRHIFETSKNDSAGFDALQKLFVFYRNKNIDSAKHYITLLYKNSDPSNHFRLGRSLMLDGSLHHRQNQYDSAENLYNQSLREYKKINFHLGISSCLNNLGILFEEKGNYDKATQYLFKNLRLTDSLGDPKEQSITLTNIGLLFQRQEQYSEALKYYEKSLALKKSIYDKRGQALLYNNIGIIHYYLEDYDKVLENFKRSLAIYRELNDLRGQAMPFFNIGEIYYEIKNDYNKALYYYKKSLDIEQELGDIKGQASSLSKIGACYMALKKYKLAAQIQKEGITRLQRIKAPVQLMTLFEDLSATYEQSGDFKNALVYFKESRIVRDSLINERNTTQITKIKESYESAKKDQEIARLNGEQTIQRLELENHIKEIDNQNRLLLFSALFILITSLSGLFIFRMYRKRKYLNEILSVKGVIIEKKNEQLSLLYEEVKKSSEIKEIFLANTTHELKTPLNVIHSFSNQLLSTPINISQQYYIEQIRNSSKELLTLVNDLLTLTKVNSGMMKTDNSAFEITETIKYLQEIYKQKAENKKITFEVLITENFPKHIISDQVRITQICSNLIDNALKFTLTGGKVQCNLNLINNNYLEIKVTDDGIGMSAEEQIQIGQMSYSNDSKLGLGINIVHSLTKLLNGTMQLHSIKNKGTTFTITIPIETDNTRQISPKTTKKEFDQFLNILVVTKSKIDSIIILDVIGMYNPGSLIDLCDDAEKAKKLLVKNKYTLILIDINTINDPNNHLLNYIRTHLTDSNAYAPVMALANNSQEIEASKMNGSVYNGYIVKPIEPNKIIEVLEQVLTNKKSTTNTDSDQKPDKLITKVFLNNPQKTVEIIEHCQKLIPEQLYKIENDLKKENKLSGNSISLIRSALVYIEEPELNSLIDDLENQIKESNATMAKETIQTIDRVWKRAEQELLSMIAANNSK